MKPREMLKGKIIDPTELRDFRNKITELKKTIVFTAGGWDLLHVGQARYLTEAKKQGDILVVGVESNDAIRKVKGPNKPILDEWIRAESLVFLKAVDFVTILPIPSCQPTLELLQPDVFISVKEEYTQGIKSSKEYKTVISYGGKVHMVDRQSPFVSTTLIVERMIGSHLGDILEKYVKQKEEPIKERFG
jgi:rfaE bifunctional protein nucleotidyltransferase chain/domain